METENTLKSHRVVTIGAGSGHFTLLDGLKEVNDPKEITAIVAFADDGSDSGRLRSELGILPPGDARRCILALAPDNRQLVIAPWLDFRFPKNGGETNGLGGRNIGNLNIGALEMMYGCQELAIKAFMEILDIPGRVIPASHNKVKLEAILNDGQSTVLQGESTIDKRGNDQHYDPSSKISYIRFNETAYLNPNAKEAIDNAEYIIVAPGDLYTSILPIFLVSGLTNALMLSKAKLIYCGNLMTKRGETDNFKASDCLRAVCKYIGERKIDYIILNQDGVWPTEATEIESAYLAEGKCLMETDIEACQKIQPKAEIIRSHLIKYTPRERIIRHDGKMLAEEIGKVIATNEYNKILSSAAMISPSATI